MVGVVGTELENTAVMETTSFCATIVSSSDWLRLIKSTDDVELIT